MKKIILIFFVLFTQINLLNAEINVVFIDMNKFMSTSKPGSSILKQLNDLNNKNLKTFQDKEKFLKEKESKIISQKNILSEKDFQLIVNQLKIEVNKYNVNRKSTTSNFNKLKISSTNKFLKMLNPILIEYSDTNTISMIFKKKDLIIGKRELDITDEIIKIINIKIKEFKVE